MKEKIKIESVNKISQIDSIDVHTNSIICDLKLEVEKVINADSDKFRDVESAKSSAYQRAKAEFGIDIIVDASFVIHRKIEISNVGWAGIAIFLVWGILVLADVELNAILNVLIPFAALICIRIGVGVFYKATISGYAGHYTNPRDYYQLQKDIMITAATAANKIFSETPKLTLEERKILELIQSGKVSESSLNSEQLQVWKKQKKIDNKSDQTDLFYSVIDANHEMSFAKTTTSGSSPLLSSITTRKKKGAMNLGALVTNSGGILKKVVAIGLILYAIMFLNGKYKEYKRDSEMEQMELEMQSDRLSLLVNDCESAITAMDQNKIDSTMISKIKWDYKTEDYEDSVARYDEIRNKLSASYNEVIGKIKAEELEKNTTILMGSIDEVQGTYSGYKDENQIEIDINGIKKNLSTKVVYRVMEYNDNYDLVVKETKKLSCKISFEKESPVFTFTEPGNKSTDGSYILKYNYNNSSINGEWVSKVNDKKRSSVYLSKKVIDEVSDDSNIDFYPADY
jgi:hypothetical protein